MKASVIALGVLLIAGTAFAVSEVTQNKVYSWRYKMTVEVETPEGVKSGSAVREIEVIKKRTGQEFTDKKHYVFKRKVIGEAVTIDLGERGTVFSLTSWNDYNDVMNAFDKPRYEDVVALPLGSKAELTEQLPVFITFKNMSDPLSVELVFKKKLYAHGFEHTDEFEKIFGSGVRLKSIVIEITDEPVTWSIDERLPWLEEVGGGYLHGGFTSKGSPLNLHGGNFKRTKSGEEK